MVVKVINEGTLFSILENHSDHAQATRYAGRPCLDHEALTPFGKSTVDDEITQFKEQSLKHNLPTTVVQRL